MSSAAFAREVCGSPEAATRLIPSRGSDQVRFACGVEGAVMSPPTARPRIPRVPYAQRSMLQRTTGAQSRAVGWEKAVCARALRRSAQTAEVLTAQGLIPARPRGSPSMQLGGGGHRPHHRGSKRRRLLVLWPRTARRAGRRLKVLPSRRWRAWRSRARFPKNVFCLPFSLSSVVLFFFFYVRRNGEKEISGTLPL